jgi:hypothetical protein
LLDIRRLITQLHGLERRTARGGKDSIDHGPGQHDDVANAVAGALVLASHHDVPLNFYPPAVGPSRSALPVDYGSGLPAAIYGAGASVKPGTFCPEAGGGGDGQFAWSINSKGIN